MYKSPVTGVWMYLTLDFWHRVHMFALSDYYINLKYTYLLTHRDKLRCIELGNNTLQNLKSTENNNQADTCKYLCKVKSASVVHITKAYM